MHQKPKGVDDLNQIRHTQEGELRWASAVYDLLQPVKAARA